MSMIELISERSFHWDTVHWLNNIQLTNRMCITHVEPSYCTKYCLWKSENIYTRIIYVIPSTCVIYTCYACDIVVAVRAGLPADWNLPADWTLLSTRKTIIQVAATIPRGVRVSRLAQSLGAWGCAHPAGRLAVRQLTIFAAHAPNFGANRVELRLGNYFVLVNMHPNRRT